MGTNQEDQAEQIQANTAFILAEAEKSRAHARLMNAQAEQLENSNKAR